MIFSQILGKNRGCGLYSGATCSPENTVHSTVMWSNNVYHEKENEILFGEALKIMGNFTDLHLKPPISDEVSNMQRNCWLCLKHNH